MTGYTLHPIIIISVSLHRFSTFADLFSEATKRGLKALQTQNPGLYYQHASLYAIERKQLSNRLCLDAARSMSAGQAASDLAIGEGCMYYGQRPWRRGLTGGCGHLFRCL